MAHGNFKSSDIVDARDDLPPSYSGPSTYAILTGPTDPIDLEEPLPVTQTPEYRALLNRLRLAMFWSVVMLGLLVFSTGFALYTGYQNAQLQTALARCNFTSANYSNLDILPPSDTLVPRTAAKRRCLTGFTEKELLLESMLLGEKYGYKGRVWMSPCSEVAGLSYPLNVVAEYNYVVLRS